jgi:hypothetical protein
MRKLFLLSLFILASGFYAGHANALLAHWTGTNCNFMCGSSGGGGSSAEECGTGCLLDGSWCRCEQAAATSSGDCHDLATDRCGDRGVADWEFDFDRLLKDASKVKNYQLSN